MSQFAHAENALYNDSQVFFTRPKDPSDPLFDSPQREKAFWRRLLFIASAVTAIAATRPWTRVEFTTLFGEIFGPAAWQGTTAGFTCLCTSALLAVMTLIETRTRTTQKAVRPASLMLATIMVLSMVLHLGRGPGTLRGVTATWTLSLYLSTAASAVVLAACAARFAAMAGKEKGKPNT
jgi:hypothetical protein